MASKNGKPGPKLKFVDAGRVLSLAQRGCSATEIAALCGVSNDTILRRFRAELDAGYANHKEAIRSAMFEEGVINRKEKTLNNLYDKTFYPAHRVELSGPNEGAVNVNLKNNLDLKNLSEEELALFNALIEKVSNRAEPSESD